MTRKKSFTTQLMLFLLGLLDSTMTWTPPDTTHPSSSAFRMYPLQLFGFRVNFITEQDDRMWQAATHSVCESAAIVSDMIKVPLTRVETYFSMVTTWAWCVFKNCKNNIRSASNKVAAFVKANMATRRVGYSVIGEYFCEFIVVRHVSNGVRFIGFPFTKLCHRSGREK